MERVLVMHSQGCACMCIRAMFVGVERQKCNVAEDCSVHKEKDESLYIVLHHVDCISRSGLVAFECVYDLGSPVNVCSHLGSSCSSWHQHLHLHEDSARLSYESSLRKPSVWDYIHLKIFRSGSVSFTCKLRSGYHSSRSSHMKLQICVSTHILTHIRTKQTLPALLLSSPPSLFFSPHMCTCNMSGVDG